MKCVILAAGEGVRMRPLTNKEPKPMLKVGGRPILEHILESLPGQIDRVILVVGYLHQKIHDHFGHHFRSLRLDYVFQEGKLGTYHALKLCESLLADDEKFLLLYADDLHGKEGLKKCSDSSGLCLLVSESEEPKKFGVIEVHPDESIKSIEEKPEEPKTNLVSTGVYLLNKNIFKYPARIHSNGEYYLTDSIFQMLEAGHKVNTVRSDFWIPIGYPEDLERAAAFMASLAKDKGGKKN